VHLSLAAAIVSSTLLLSCGDPQAAPPPSAASSESGSDPLVEVATTTVRRGSISHAISAPGTLVARRESRVGAEVRARIERVYVEEGDRVEAGEPLFQIDPSAYEMALRQANAGLDVAGAQRHQLEADLARARRLKRENVVAEQEIERLETSLQVAKAQQRQAEEAVALARHNLEQTVVRAPYAGSIAARLADEGTTALVQPQTIVVVLQETAELEARATIPESQLAMVRIGDEALVRVEGIPEPIRTEISAVSDTIDPATRTYLVKMPVPNPDYALKAGVFAHIEIFPKAKRDALLVPRLAVRTEDGRTRVLIVEDGRAVAAPVEIGIVSEEDAEVLSGLAEGDEVIVGKEAGIIAPGMKVRVAGTTPAA
jgi:RND family efflux transporter MFP subunit